ncbi:hypothetical protein PHJA_002313800 [Phtheirospermum japonicum]|uniref:NAB domain-containing protein n=1 Tax=Phtheirospermum japonicum TaxID=374723 RepID=A0A830CVR4_9LAMI|nr:hypothetical protein PHJA_002313800 [Phtheirospermum japonicum]
MRANSHYHGRPQLLELLHDLYNDYLSLADHYCQALSKNQTPNNHPSRCSLSFQPPMIVKTKEMDFDMVITDLVMKTVECDIILNKVNVVEKRWGESSRKIELQKNLLEVLESERLILLNDNATLGYRVTALADENKGLASESLFLKRKAAELAMEIYGLEKRNKEYYEQIVKCEEKKLVDLEDCFRAGRGGGPRPGGFGKCFSFKVKKVEKSGGAEVIKVSKMWDKVKKFDLLLCGPHVDCAIETVESNSAPSWKSLMSN